MKVKDYQRKLNNIITMAPQECGVQTLVYMFLDEIIENQGLVLLEVDLFGQDTVFARQRYGTEEKGVPDMCIVEKTFKYPGKIENNINKEKKKRKACVEVKATSTDLAKEIEKRNQIIGHILEYKKVIYTNGCVWIYFDITKPEKNECEENVIEYIKKLKGYIEAILNNNEKEKVVLPEWIRWIIPIVKLEDKKTKQCKFITYTDINKREEIIIDTENYNCLIKELYKIDWGVQCEITYKE